MPDTNQEEKKTGEQPELIDIQWQAPEFEKYEKGPGWFIVLGIFALIIFTIVLLMKNFIFAILIILAVFTIFIYALKEPRLVTFKISGKGITIDTKIYSYDELKSFWIFYQPPQIREISLRSKKTIMPYIKIPLGEQNPVEIRKILLKYLPERRHKESLIDNLSRSLRF